MIYRVFCGVGILANIAFAFDFADKENRFKNYAYSAQVGTQYTQGYGEHLTENVFEGKRNNFQSLFASVGFEGREFEYLRFGANLLGNVKLGKNTSIYKKNITSNAILYQAFVGFDSKYFDISAGREEIDLEWVSDFVEGARLAFEIPDADTQISAYYFYRKGEAEINSIVPFENERIGHSVIAGISNDSFDDFLVETYFMNIDLFNGFWLAGRLKLDDDDITSNTIIKYTFLNSKISETSNLNYFQLEEDLKFDTSFGDISFVLGAIKMLSPKNDLAAPKIDILGDNNPLEQGYQAYFKNALSIYGGIKYEIDDFFDIKVIYGNTTSAKNEDNIKLKAINELDISFGLDFMGFETAFVYSKLWGKTLPTQTESKLNRDCFEVMLAYDF